ncbi:unnamed protein product [marine sediment metagenome]|uniref:Uncharacterized protein n=1 Tax=marine sediment metagenome TaxID=412755 RepID=X1DRK8_9ZZZZ
MVEHTLIQVKKTTRAKLRGLRIMPRDTYDNIILNLIKNQNK